MKKGKHEAPKTVARKMTPALRAILAIALCVLIPTSALAAVEADISLGNVSIGDTQVTHTVVAGESPITQDHSGSVTIIQTDISAPTSNTVTVTTTTNDVSVTLDNVNMSSSTPVDVNAGAGTTVTVELDGSNVLNSTSASLHKGGEGALVIEDANSDGGSLEANTTGGGNRGASAAIGGKMNESASNITINSGIVDATSNYGAAIGGGQYGDASNININGGTVNAQSGYGAAIGAGQDGNASNININGGDVNAKANYGAAIGAGQDGSAEDINITGGDVTATGSYGAAIGGGQRGESSDIDITGGEVTAEGNFGAAIGSGQYADASDIEISGDAEVTANSIKGAAIGGGMLGAGSDVSISGDAQVDASSELGAAIGGGSGSWAKLDGETDYTWHDGGSGSDISISGNAAVNASSESGAAIGGGSNGNLSSSTASGGSGSNISISEGAQVSAESTNGSAFGGAETDKAVEPDTSGLYDSGKVENKNDDSVTTGTIPTPDKPPQPSTPADPVAPSPVPTVFQYISAYIEGYSVFMTLDGNNRAVFFEEKLDGDVLYITIKSDTAKLSCNVSALSKLIDEGISKVVFITDSGKTGIVLEDILNACRFGGKLLISMDGSVYELLLKDESRSDLLISFEELELL